MPKMLRDRSRIELEVKCDYGCCRTNDTSRTARHSARQMEKRELATLLNDESSSEEFELTFIYEPHIYDGGRCIFCGVNDLDDSIYGPYRCIERPRYLYTTETKRGS